MAPRFDREDRFRIVTEAQVVLVAVDEQGKPVPILRGPA